MLKILLRPQLIERAKLKMPEKLPGSITDGKSSIYGAIGELIVQEHYGAQDAGSFDYDLLINGNRVDVKTKRTTVNPRGHFLCSVADYNTTQQCDFYFFCRVHESLKEAWLLGFISKERFYREATFAKKGDPDGKFRFKADCYNIPINKLIWTIPDSTPPTPDGLCK